MSRPRPIWPALFGALTVLTACSGGQTPPTAHADPPVVVAGERVDLRRLTAAQYRNIIRDVFGADINIGGRFEPGLRQAGLLAAGASQLSITATGYEQYEKMARTIAAQVLDEKRRALFLQCKPVAAAQPDDTCAREFLGGVGRLLYRRPLTDRELAAQVKAAATATREVRDFHQGLAFSLAAMLTSPEFLFRHEVLAPASAHQGVSRLDDFSVASRLSFFLWNAAPDAALLVAAEKGELGTRKGLAQQVDRMLASRRLEEGVRAFFGDMLGFDGFETLAKDPALYTKYNYKIAADAQEQTLRTIIDHLLFRRGDYRDLFTTRETFLTPRLAAVYRIKQPAPLGFPNAWQRYEYPAGTNAAGILTHLSFVGLHSHPGRTSPTLRGKALREVLLCQQVPDPPGNVDFKVVQDTASPQYKTVRARLAAHSTEAMCKGCHKITDPLGLALETFDTTGAFRTAENNVAIDEAGELDGVKFTNAAGLGQAVHDNPATAACLTTRLYSYGVGRKPSDGEAVWLKEEVVSGFATNGYQLVGALRRIALSEAFYMIADSAPARVAEVKP